jgi:hypothetical protein
VSDADDKLTPEQISNWKLAFPEFAFCTDEMIQRLRDEMQRRLDADAATETEADNQ